MEPIVPSHKLRTNICGEVVLFQTNSLEILAAVKASLAGSEDTHLKDTDPLVVALFLDEDNRSIPPQPRNELRFNFRMHRHLFTMSWNEKNSAVADLVQGYASGYITSDALQTFPEICARFFGTLSLAMLPLSRGLLPLHASCVVKEGAGILFLGEPGAGKSTLAAASIQRGFSLLADDSVFLKREDHELLLVGWPRKIRLSAESMQLLAIDHLLEGEIAFTHDKKIEFDPTLLSKQALAQSAQPQLLVFLEQKQDQRTPHANKLSRREVAERIEIPWAFQLDWSDDMQEGLEQFLDTPAFELMPGVNPNQTIDWVIRYLHDMEPG